MKPCTLAVLFVLFAHCLGDVTPMTQATMLAMPFSVRVTLVVPKHVDAVLPIPTRQLLPEYPLVMREARIQGEARVGFTVEADGRITKLKLLHATEKAFGEATLKAAKAWRFSPGKGRDGYVARELEYLALFELP